MARLIVDEGGQRRAFKLGEGVLTIGSGEQARLRLASGDVADVHAELELRAGQVLLRARPGVMPPSLDGLPITGECVVKRGETIEIGNATIEVEDSGPAEAPLVEEPSGGAAKRPARAAAAAGVGATAVRAQPASRSGGAPAQKKRVRRTAMQQASEETLEERRARYARQRGMPTWAIVGLLLAGAGVIVLIMVKAFTSASSTTTPIDATLNRAARVLDEGGIQEARDALASIAPTVELTPAQRQRREALEERLRVDERQGELNRQNNIGSEYLAGKLQRYEEKWLQGRPETPKVRLFLKRLRYFRERWPQHPDMDWVERQESRFAGVVSLADPPTWADVDWEVFYITDAKPREYGEAFRLLEQFEKSATPEQKQLIAEKRAELLKDRREYHEDRLNEARWLWESKNQEGEAYEWLVQSVMKIGDEEMANEAAVFLLKCESEFPFLESYKISRPHDWEMLIQNALIRDHAKEQGLL